MTQDDASRRIELEVVVPGTPEQVWDAIATGPGISAWMHPAEVEERAGGRFACDIDEPAPGIAHLLVYGDSGWATVQACLYGDDAAAIAAREERAWREWTEARFSAAAA